MLSVEEFDKIQKVENAKNIAIDFDGVIHDCSKGYHDGTVYGDPLPGAFESIKLLKQKGFNIVIFSCKSRSDRPPVNGKMGTEMVWDWFEKYNMKEFISDVVAEKPRAICFIDDKGVRFQNWKQCLNDLKNLNIVQ
tara:strand:- start:2895 stop:3302 length:408 start_codon:yes stop_codon:yes gene_type:complete